jgi:phenylpropionate dioxygenase-like ring-hydroxylating dioxygenase large terminal subunit
VTESAHPLQRSWFVAALSRAVTAQPQAVLLFGQPVVLVRNHGRVWALEDRCPHRGAPLSAGRLTAKGLECPYHGWTFDADGICRDMPGLSAAAPPTVRVPAFAVIERDGLVWVSTRLSDDADRVLPERITCLDPAQQRFVWQSLWRTPVLEVQENFLDALHTHFIHPGLVRRGDARRELGATLKVAGDGFVVDYAGAATQSGLLFRLFESARVSERAFSSALSVAQLEYRYASGATIWITLCCTPRDERATHVFATLHVAGRWAPRWLVRWAVWPLLRRVAAQDQSILETLERRCQEFFPGRLPLVTPQDLARPYLQAAWEGRLPALPAQVSRVLRV